MNELELKQVLEFLSKEQNVAKIRAQLIDYHPYDLASIIKSLEKEQRLKIYQAFNNEELADIFEYLDEEDTVLYLEEMNIKKGAKVLTNMEVDDAADVLNEMDDDDLANAYLEEMNTADKDELNYLTTHEEDTAGSVMTTNYIEIDAKMDVRDAMRRLVKEADETEVINPLFVCEDGNLKGIIALKDLIIARTPNKIEDIMETNIISVQVDEDINAVTQKIQDYDIYACPVLDGEKLVGIITIDDALDEVVDDFVEDYGKMAGVTNDIDEKTSVFKNMMKRIPWLICLLIISLLISNITSQFENVIVTVTIFAFFQSMIFDMAGNVGTQSLAITVRSLGHHELDSAKQIFHHLWKELRVIVINSLILGCLAFGTSYIFMLINNDNQQLVEWLVALIIAGSMSITLTISGMLGSIIPIMLNKIKIDPAVASGPLITTLSDTISILVYFGLATAFMNIIMGGAM